MDNLKDDNYFVQKIVADLEYIVAHTADVEKAQFCQDELLRDATLFHMIQMSESVRKLSEEFRKVHAEFPWNEIYGMRNRIVHDYGSVDLNIVFDTVKNDIPELLTRLTQL